MAIYQPLFKNVYETQDVLCARSKLLVKANLEQTGVDESKKLKLTDSILAELSIEPYETVLSLHPLAR